jgi:ABC-type transporter Mla subunit MlaD
MKEHLQEVRKRISIRENELEAIKVQIDAKEIEIAKLQEDYRRHLEKGDSKKIESAHKVMQAAKDRKRDLEQIYKDKQETNSALNAIDAESLISAADEMNRKMAAEYNELVDLNDAALDEVAERQKKMAKMVSEYTQAIAPAKHIISQYSPKAVNEVPEHWVYRKVAKYSANLSLRFRI